MTRGCAAASTLLVSRAFLSAAACARGKARRLSELQDPTQAVERAYICELYASPSHAKLPAHIRAEQLFELLITALEQVHVDGWRPGGVLRMPPFVRCGRRVDEPRVNEASLDLGAVGRVEVPSRRHADSTPAAKVQPVRALPAERTRPEQVAHFTLTYCVTLTYDILYAYVLGPALVERNGILQLEYRNTKEVILKE